MSCGGCRWSNTYHPLTKTKIRGKLYSDIIGKEQPFVELEVSSMGYYLNSPDMLELYKSEVSRPYFVDKSAMLSELIPLVEEGKNHICITRPRRFGKSVMATMIGSYFGRGVDAGIVFEKLEIAKDTKYLKHLNKHDVIYIDFSKVESHKESYAEYINCIVRELQDDLYEAFPDVKYRENATVENDLKRIFGKTRRGFIFVFDEWDYIFHKPYVTDTDKEHYINFLAKLTKGQAYIEFVYMTGILPIEKYSSGSSLNHFSEYTMATQSKYSAYFGFTDNEVDELFSRYLSTHNQPKVTREDLKTWYDGYYTKAEMHMYNPRSVVRALTDNMLTNYWTASGPYDEVAKYIVNDVIPDLKKQIALLVSGQSIPLRINERAAVEKEFTTLNQLFSAMVVYGLLNYYTDENGAGFVCIPNKELMDEFARTLEEKPEMGFLNLLAQKSSKMLEATLKGDTQTMAEILEYAHNTESPIFDYNNEIELAAIVNLVYLAARDTYEVCREDKGGRGYVDFVFLPKKNKAADGFILELKVNATPEEALQQIKDRQYILRFAPKLGEEAQYTGHIRAYGISYDGKSGKHECKTELLR